MEKIFFSQGDLFVRVSGTLQSRFINEENWLIFSIIGIIFFNRILSIKSAIADPLDHKKWPFVGLKSLLLGRNIAEV